MPVLWLSRDVPDRSEACEASGGLPGRGLVEQGCGGCNAVAGMA